ncbi:hypothetical protein [Bifidobacterium hapali]|uniref:hypothetical protein n=1 Tax=Bifidobacterium hapali TaxID=1630172 RepID=UPI001178497C|nr:hypothetical protein [Bifidobacterium hapali]
MRHMAWWRRICVIAVAMVMVCGVAGCGAGDTQASTVAASDDYIDQLFARDRGQKIASSFDERIDQTITGVEHDSELEELDPTGEYKERKLEILRRTKQAGSMSAADYESIWANYRQCMTDRGYKNIILLKQVNGVYTEAGHRIDRNNPRERTYTKDMMECGIIHTGYLNSLYKDQQGNPNLFKNPFEGALDCMHRNNYVPKDYSLDDLKHDLYGDVTDKSQLKADIYGAQIPSCLIANNITVLPEDAPLEEL